MTKHADNVKKIWADQNKELDTPVDFAEIETTHEQWIEKRKATISTFTGLTIDLLNPTPDMICIEDIAHGLSNTCRWAGQCSVYYSVAQHSIWCAMNVSPDNMLDALLHDAAEAYIGDITTPLKKALPCYKKVEDGIMECIAEKFGITYPKPSDVKYIDDKSKDIELSMLSRQHSAIFKCLTPFEAEEKFLELYRTITVKKDAK